MAGVDFGRAAGEGWAEEGGDVRVSGAEQQGAARVARGAAAADAAAGAPADIPPSLLRHNGAALPARRLLLLSQPKRPLAAGVRLQLASDAQQGLQQHQLEPLPPLPLVRHLPPRTLPPLLSSVLAPAWLEPRTGTPAAPNKRLPPPQQQQRAGSAGSDACRNGPCGEDAKLLPSLAKQVWGQ